MKKMRALIKAKHISQSKWIAAIIGEKLETEWPESVVALAGAWQDFPELEEIRAADWHV
ncbi:MAG: CopG family transcriptional regulator [Chloroflexi bacterium]|nr:CopG family transcriptional regulator [Chloroflexota bacterium]